MMIANIHCKVIIFLTVLLLGSGMARAQFADCSTGLLQMPTAEVQDDGTFMITNNFLNKHSLASGWWGYNTFQYGIYVSLWRRIEIGYVCTIVNDNWKGYQTFPGVTMINQDRHFTGRVLLVRENEFGWKWVPALMVGVSDPTTGAGGGEYLSGTVSGSGNGFFNRYFVILTKHFDVPYGRIGVHAGYQYNHRIDYPIDSPCIGVDWTPVWTQNKGVLDGIKIVLEYDSRTINMGFIASILNNHYEVMFELQSFQWVNFGLRYKLRLKK